MQRLYRARGEAAAKAAALYLKDVAEPIVPKAGMFMWMRFKGEWEGSKGRTTNANVL